MKVTKPGQKAPRMSKKYSSGRYCALKNCTTMLSTYNSKKYCFFHRPVSYPRLRGHVLKEGSK
tara:strand:+ start:978 stop:1166 length:189 start_codon:yes stop_codon:yes gene_type:complete